ncbi:hypothetical protein BS78_08G008200 [Paspalum vaginatum]|nr:hypothetical protein BS78_08G008200 [Paspalum vaginatum]
MDLMQFGEIPYNGRYIKESFSDRMETDITILDDCVKCLSYDDMTYRPEFHGTRIFLGPTVCMALDPEQHGPKDGDKEFKMDILVGSIKTYLPATDFSKTKLVFLTMFYRNHYLVYCVNFEHGRIDVLDSLDFPSLNTKFNAHHDNEKMGILQQRLCNALQIFSKRFPDFRRWRRIHFTKAPVMVHENDCASIAFRFLEAYDGESLSLTDPIDTVSQCANSSQLRSGMLHYMMFHPTNRIKLLPPEIEKYRQDGVPF